ncbi:DegV family protein [Romboutsia sedimentorum]|uniref:DegV family protein n=1 Tax=Romboutsia sedimentorum TaxID=1368474 RepID=A0ABT7E984_9FIRM|nr:DegV family protein [Romboutsia sedimentorum]MDK2563457.1 DegV family protein [Romboutsia sedimentorum]
MDNIKIICDSLSDIPMQLIEKYDIEVVPLSIMFNEKEYIDGIDLTKVEFYKMLRENDKLPKTSQVTYMAFKNIFEKYISQNRQIIYIGGSSKTSGTYQSAVMAKNDIKQGSINTFDSLSLSIGIGCMVLIAAKLAKEGKKVEEILNHLENLRSSVSLLFTVETLDYLQKGGRISLAKATIGNMLNIKPILCLEDGLIKPIFQVRGKKQAINKIVDIIKEQYGEDLSNKQVIVGCGDIDLEALKKKLNEEFKLEEILEVNLGSCICAHTGPGVFGIACCDK